MKKPIHRTLVSKYAVAAVVVAITAVVNSAAAHAFSYTVPVCDGAGGRYDSIRWPTPNRPPREYPGYASCPTQGSAQRGIVTREVGNGYVARGFRRRAYFLAPRGTTIGRVRWRGRFNVGGRTPCRWNAGLWAYRAGAWRVLRGLNGTTGRCATSQVTQSSLVDLPVGPGAAALLQQVHCAAGDRCDRGATAHTFDMRVEIVDHQPPSATVTGGGLFCLTGRYQCWVRAEQRACFSASDNTGTHRAQLYIDGRPISTAAKSYAYNRAAAVQAPTAISNDCIGFNTTDLAEGLHSALVQVQSPSGWNGATGWRAFRVDNSVPTPPEVSVDGGQNWRTDQQFTLRWPQPPSAAPIMVARYQLCREDGTGCQIGVTRPLENVRALSVRVGEGSHRLRVWLEDAAGNGATPQNQSKPVYLRSDRTPPSVAFDAPLATDPLRVSATVSDSVSGAARGTIEMRRRGTNTWQALPTRLEGSRLVAHVDDQRIERGVVEFRAHAFDHAGNERSTDRRADGQLATLALPVRVVSRLRIGVASGRRAVVRRKGRRRVVKRRRFRAIATKHIRLGRRVSLRGRLTNADGQPMSGVNVTVYGGPREGDGLFIPIGVARTGPDGWFRYLLRGRRSETLRFRYAGTTTIRPATRDLAVRVPAATTIRPSRRRVWNGEAVAFAGRLLGSPRIRGKLVVLQVFIPGKGWTIPPEGDGRTRRGGRWRLRYRFTNVVGGRLRVRFRACLPRDGSYPFEKGCSKRVRVSVSGP